MGLFDKIREGLTRTRQAMSREIQAVFGKGKLTDEIIEALEEKLLAADIGWDTAHAILEGVRKRARGQEIDQAQLLSWMADEARDMLPEAPPSKLDAKPYVILLVGVNGAGKT